ncbi:MAG TPA: type II secretion system protein GspL [Burkholderiaceae bacterium]
MSTLYIRLPSKAAADSAPHVIDLSCHFALAADNGVIEREGVSMLSHLVDPITQAQRVVLLLAASDVNLLHVKVPPMSAARLKAALPNLIEDQLISDPAECVIVAGPASEGLRTVAVVNRVWLDLLLKVLLELGARQVAAVPAQLCLPYEPGKVTAAVGELNDDIDVTIRFSEEEGMGLAIVPDQHDTIVHDVVQTLGSVVPEAPVSLYVQASSVAAYQAELTDSALAERCTVFPDSWTHWASGAKGSSFNLMAGLGMAAGPGFNWNQWRWPLRIAAAVVIVNLLGLNVEWWRLKHEASSLRSGMIQTFKLTYPKEPVTANPVAQMRGKIAQAQHDAGQSAPDDFTALAAGFGEVWTNVLQGSKTPSIAALEYADRSLLVRLKTDGTAPTAQMKTALASHNLSLTEQKAGEWLIRSAK